MFNSKESTAIAVGALMALAENYNKGDVMTWSDVAKAMEMPHHEGWGIVGKFRRRLRQERGIVTFCIPMVGIRFLRDVEVVREVPAMRRKRIMRQSSKAVTELSAVDTSGLSEFQRAMLAKQKESLERERNDQIQERKRYKAIFGVDPDAKPNASE